MGLRTQSFWSLLFTQWSCRSSGRHSLSSSRGRGHRGRQEAPSWARGPAGAAGEAPGPGLTTGRVQRAALGRRHPEVGGARVKDDSEGLRRGADADLAVVLGLQGKGERWPEGLGGALGSS